MTYTRITTIIGMVGLAIALTAGSARAAVEDVLLEKGTITKEDWLKIKAEKGNETVSNLLKGIELKATFYFDYTYATGDSFTGDVANKGINNPTANNNRGLATGFHFTRTYLTLIKRFDEGHHFRLTLDQMVNNVGGNSCQNGAGSSAGNCHEAAPFGLSGFAGTGRNTVFVKSAYYNHVVLPGLEVRVGQHQNPWIEYEEHRWTYRFRGPVMVDEQNFQTSSDLGVSFLGKVLNNMVDYHVSLQSGEGYQNTQDGRGLAALGRVSIEPFPGVIVSGFYHNERERNGIEGFNPQRLLGNVEVYDPQADRFKVNAQAVWADDGGNVGTGLGPAIFVPGTYNGNDAVTAVTYGARNGPSTSIPRFHQARGYEFWGYYRIPMIEKMRLFSRYYFMKPNKDTTAGNIQSILFGISYDFAKYFSVALDYTLLKETGLGTATTVGGQVISTSSAGNGGGPTCTTCGRTGDYDNQIFGVKVLVAF